MKILVIAHYFAPNNAIGSIRSSKFAKYIIKSGHEVRVVAAEGLDSNLPLEIDAEAIKYYKVRGKGIKRHLSILKNCTISSIKVARDFQPDIIFASSPPPHVLISAMIVSKLYGIKWIADFRDLWALQYGNRKSNLRLSIESRLERLIIKSSSGIVTISQGLKDVLSEMHKVPIKIIPNGYDPDDFVQITDSCSLTNSKDSIELVYAGTVYEGKQDYALLLNVLANEKALKHKVRLKFYGTECRDLEKMVQDLDLSDRVHFNPRIPYREMIQIQKQADGLILFLWKEDSHEKGVFPGKFFEYIATDRPVLIIGDKDCDLAKMIENEPSLSVCSDGHELYSFISLLIYERQNSGEVKNVSHGLKKTFRRDLQSIDLLNFLKSLKNKDRLETNE